MTAANREYSNLGDFARVGTLLLDNGIVPGVLATIQGPITVAGNLTVQNTSLVFVPQVVFTLTGDAYAWCNQANTALNIDSSGTQPIRFNSNQGGIANAGTGGLALYPGNNSATASWTVDGNGNMVTGGLTVAPAVAGGTGIVSLGTLARVTGANFTTSSAPFVNVTGLIAPLLANAVYAVCVGLSINSSSVAGMSLGLGFSAAGAAVEGQLMGTTTAAATQMQRMSAFSTGGGGYCINGGDGSASIEAIVTTGANPGNLTVVTAKTTSGTATVYQNSVLSVTRIA